MSLKLLMILTVFVSGCHVFDSSLPRPKAVYGGTSENTITVTVGKGFRSPGIHHVSRGTTVREFLKRVPMLSNPGKGAEAGMWSLRVGQLRNGDPAGFISHYEPTEKELDTILENGAQIVVIKYND